MYYILVSSCQSFQNISCIYSLVLSDILTFLLFSYICLNFVFNSFFPWRNMDWHFACRCGHWTMAGHHWKGLPGGVCLGSWKSWPFLGPDPHIKSIWVRTADRPDECFLQQSSRRGILSSVHLIFGQTLFTALWYTDFFSIFKHTCKR